MDNNRLIIPAIIIILILIAAVIIAFSGNNTFNTGSLSFEYPNAWSQDHVVGDFTNSSLYSEVTLTSNIPTSASPTSYIIIQMQKKSQGTYNLPETNEIVMNTTNSTVGSTNIGNIKATQLATYGPNVCEKVTIIETPYNYLILEYICPPTALNQTETDYNTILQSLMIQ